MRVVLDANVVIAAAASRGLCEAVFELCLQQHQLVSCTGLIAEIRQKLREKLRLPAGIVTEYLRLLHAYAELLPPAPVQRGVCRDPADEMLLGLVIPGRIDVIVIGDKDLLVLEQFETARIMNPRVFWESTRGDGSD
jgi:putative PIN family toxin of toxin-antitoxin system